MKVFTINNVSYSGNFVVQIEFSDGQTREIDFKPVVHNLKGPVFEPLKRESFFKQLSIDTPKLAIQWPNGADIGPLSLRSLGKVVQPSTTIRENPPTVKRFNKGKAKAAIYKESTVHKAPHVHIYGPGYQASISIKTARFLDGSLPKKVEKEVLPWIKENKQTLLKAWDTVQAGYPLDSLD